MKTPSNEPSVTVAARIPESLHKELVTVTSGSDPYTPAISDVVRRGIRLALNEIGKGKAPRKRRK